MIRHIRARTATLFLADVVEKRALGNAEPVLPVHVPRLIGGSEFPPPGEGIPAVLRKNRIA